jgi:hypothetical protein
MFLGNSLAYTVIYSYRCSCGASNTASLIVQAPTEYAALETARTKPISSCGAIGARENLRAYIQMLSF